MIFKVIYDKVLHLLYDLGLTQIEDSGKESVIKAANLWMNKAGIRRSAGNDLPTPSRDKTAESVPPDGDRVKAFENSGATSVTPVAPVDTSVPSAEETEDISLQVLSK